MYSYPNVVHSYNIPLQYVQQQGQWFLGVGGFTVQTEWEAIGRFWFELMDEEEKRDKTRQKKVSAIENSLSQSWSFFSLS